MNDLEQKTNIKEQILKDIREKNIKMRPKLYYTIKVILLISTLTAIIFSTIFLFNFILFSMRINCHDALLGFGPKGWKMFIMNFPWYLLAIDLILILILEWLLRQFRFGYKSPMLYLLGGILVITITSGFILDKGTELNDRFYENKGQGLPIFINSIYSGAQHIPPKGSGLCRCAIISIKDNILVVEDARTGTTTISVVVPKNSYRATTTNLNIGDIIFIAGEERDGIIEAFGIRKEILPIPR